MDEACISEGFLHQCDNLGIAVKVEQGKFRVKWPDGLPPHEREFAVYFLSEWREHVISALERREVEWTRGL